MTMATRTDSTGRVQWLLLDADQLDIAQRLADRTSGADGALLERVVGNYVDATFSGDSQDTLEAGAELYNGVPRWLGEKIFGPSWDVEPD